MFCPRDSKANRVLTRPEGPHCGFVHNNDRRAVGRIVLSERPPADQLDPHRVEVTTADCTKSASGIGFPEIFGERFCINAGLTSSTRQWCQTADAFSLNSGQRLHAREQNTVKRYPLFF